MKRTTRGAASKAAKAGGGSRQAPKLAARCTHLTGQGVVEVPVCHQLVKHAVHERLQVLLGKRRRRHLLTCTRTQSDAGMGHAPTTPTHSHNTGKLSHPSRKVVVVPAGSPSVSRPPPRWRAPCSVQSVAAAPSRGGGMATAQPHKDAGSLSNYTWHPHPRPRPHPSQQPQPIRGQAARTLPPLRTSPNRTPLHRLLPSRTRSLSFLRTSASRRCTSASSSLRTCSNSLCKHHARTTQNKAQRTGARQRRTRRTPPPHTHTCSSVSERRTQ
jgi:hypothetical protein